MVMGREMKKECRSLRGHDWEDEGGEKEKASRKEGKERGRKG